MHLGKSSTIQESKQASVFVRCITRSTIYEKLCIFQYNSNISLKKHINIFITACFLSLCQHDFCDVSVTLYNASVTLSSALSKKLLDEHPWFGHLLGKGCPLGSRLWCITVSLSLSHWYPGSGVVLDCIDS